MTMYSLSELPLGFGWKSAMELVFKVGSPSTLLFFYDRSRAATGSAIEFNLDGLDSVEIYYLPLEFL